MQKETVLRVAGMTCENCVKHVRSALLDVTGVESADVVLAQGIATVRHRPDLEVSKLIDAVNEEGYEASEEA